MDIIDASTAFLGGLDKDKGSMRDSTIPSETHTIVGTATSDSADGLVMVDLEGYTISEEDQQSLELPTTVDVHEGDTVQVTLVGGVGKSPIVTGVVGGGDRLSNNVTEALDAAQAAADAVAGVVDVKKYFFHDDDGAHVTTVAERADEGLNSLWDNTDLHFRDGTDDVARFGASGSQLGRDDEAHLVMDYNSMEIQDEGDASFFFLGDLRDANYEYQAVQEFEGDGGTLTFFLYSTAMSVVSVTINGVETASYTVSGKTLSFANAPASGEEIVCTYITNDVVPTFTMGNRTGSVAPFSTATGDEVEASGVGSHAEGTASTASGDWSHAEGSSDATGFLSHAEGVGIASGRWSHAESHATATAQDAHAESGGFATGAYAHAEGDSRATGSYSHAEGGSATASGTNSHAEGYSTTAFADNSHAEGIGSIAGGYASHTEGRLTNATGNYAHAEGYGTDASGTAQHVFGQYNVPDANAGGIYAEIVGNGAYGATSNARTLDWNGNEELQGTIYLGGCTANGETPYSGIRYNTSTSQLEYYNGSSWQSIQVGGGAAIGDCHIYTGSIVKTVSGKEATLWNEATFKSTFNTTRPQLCGVMISNGDSGTGDTLGATGAEYWTSGTYQGWHARWVNNLGYGGRRFNYIVVVPNQYSTV